MKKLKIVLICMYILTLSAYAEENDQYETNELDNYEISINY